jgi:hypothetical protein
VESLKPAVWLVWFGAAGAVLFGDGRIATAGLVVFWVTLLAHLVEFAVKRPLFERAGGSMRHHFVQTLIYGLFYWKPIEERSKGPEGA